MGARGVHVILYYMTTSYEMAATGPGQARVRREGHLTLIDRRAVRAVITPAMHEAPSASMPLSLTEGASGGWGEGGRVEEGVRLAGQTG